MGLGVHGVGTSGVNLKSSVHNTMSLNIISIYNIDKRISVANEVYMPHTRLARAGLAHQQNLFTIHFSASINLKNKTMAKFSCIAGIILFNFSKFCLLFS